MSEISESSEINARCTVMQHISVCIGNGFSKSCNMQLPNKISKFQHLPQQYDLELCE